MTAGAKRGLIAISLVALAGCSGMGRNAAGRDVAASPLDTLPAVTFAQADANGDARITPEEFHAWLRQSAAPSSAQAAAGGTSERGAFDAADTNLNGVLTLDEWQAMMAGPSSARVGR